jgi:OOP family OmpA-OmpF porin
MTQHATRQKATQRWTQSARTWAWKSIAACAVIACVAGHAQAQEKTAAVAANRIEALADVYDLQGKTVAAGQSRIIFYRANPVRIPGAATVYVNGRYHASLVGGAYSPVCVMPGKVELGVRQLDIKRRANRDGFDAITQMSLQGGQNHYVRVNDERTRNLELIPVKAADAEKEIARTRLQVHTISRVDAVDCEDVPEVKPVIKPPRQLQLAGDTLFAFNRADPAGLTQQGLRAIDQLMAQINSEFSQVERVHVIGHTDPFGSDAYNENLSAQRALTVRQYMEGRRQINGRVTSEGRGKRDLLVTSCGTELTQANIDCNQPNRRVTIEVTGTTRVLQQQQQ